MTTVLVRPVAVAQQVAAALAEDIGSGDLTAALVPATAVVRGRVLVRESAVLCGRPWFEAVFEQLDPTIRLRWLAEEGDRIQPDQTVCEFEGNARAVLTGERTALNFLQTLSATATQVARYVDVVAGTKAMILDTRKTIPGLRMAQKYAVSCGGGSNHRIGLFDAVLIKENHIRAAGSIDTAVNAARDQVAAGVLIEVEVEDLDELNQALDAGVTRVLLDNFDNGLLREAVALNRGRAQLEASGGVNLDTVRGIAETGVDFISVGQLTKDIRATDFSMLFEHG